MAQKTGVLVVDDSAFMRKIITEIIGESAEFEVVDTARDGQDALDKLANYGDRVQLVTLDIQMPRMDGLTCLKKIMEKSPRRVIMVSSLTTEGAKETIESLENGAIDFLAKPGGAISVEFRNVAPELMRILQTAANSRVPQAGKKRTTLVHHAAAPPAQRSVMKGFRRLVAVASSTGGPKALANFIPFLPRDLRAAMLVVQHMPATFTKFLAERLDKASKLKVKEAEEGDQLLEGLCLIAPGGFHMEVTREETIHLTKDPPIGGLRPCADVTFRTIAQVFGSRAMAVVLTGMGQDGTDGCRVMRDRGSKVLAESADTALIYGMPRSVAEKKLVDRQAPIDDMAQAVVETLDSI